MGKNILVYATRILEYAKKYFKAIDIEEIKDI